MRGATRGQALVELALLAPLLMTAVLVGLVLSEVVRARLATLEVARFSAWEMASFALSDYGPKARGQAGAAEMRQAARSAFAAASGDVRARGFARFCRMGTAGVASLAPVQVSLVDGAVAGAGGTARWTEAWGLNALGLVRAEASTRLRCELVPAWLFQGREAGWFSGSAWGEADLGALPLRERAALVADDWHSPDGLDSNLVPGRAGKHGRGVEGAQSEDSLLYRQVGRMTFLGVDQGDALAPLRAHGWGAVLRAVRFPEPAFRGTFVVSHGYRDNASSGLTRGCDGVSHSGRHPAMSGLNNLAPPPRTRDYGPGAEPEQLGSDAKLSCFDTTPFRDTQSYEGTSREPGALPIHLFEHRGRHFMGCQNAMADDPSQPHGTATGDDMAQTVDCE